jgi:hypothetical protein
VRASDTRAARRPAESFSFLATALVMFTKCSMKCLYGSIDLPFESEFMQVEAGIVLKSPDQKNQVFLVLIVLLCWFLSHVHKVFTRCAFVLVSWSHPQGVR